MASGAAHSASLSCVPLQDLVKMERAIWSARLHEKLYDELACFSFEGTRIETSLPELSTWVQVGATVSLIMETYITAGMSMQAL